MWFIHFNMNFSTLTNFLTQIKNITGNSMTFNRSLSNATVAKYSYPHKTYWKHVEISLNTLWQLIGFFNCLKTVLIVFHQFQTFIFNSFSQSSAKFSNSLISDCDILCSAILRTLHKCSIILTSSECQGQFRTLILLFWHHFYVIILCNIADI